MRGTHQGQQSPRGTASTGRTHDCKRPLHHAPHDLLQDGGHPHMSWGDACGIVNLPGQCGIRGDRRIPKRQQQVAGEIKARLGPPHPPRINPSPGELSLRH
jgi:hypothetical protein